MSQEETESIIQIAEIHKQRLLQALAVIDSLFPLTADNVENLNEHQLFAMETLISRFAKLQDLMGTKLFDLCLIKLGDSIDGLSMIDKANKLEKASILDNTHNWMDLRKLRNSVTHEYPGHPEITASIINKLHDRIQSMLDLYSKIISVITST